MSVMLQLTFRFFDREIEKKPRSVYNEYTSCSSSDSFRHGFIPEKKKSAAADTRSLS